MRRREFLELSAAGAICSAAGGAFGESALPSDAIRGRAVADGKGLAATLVVVRLLSLPCVTRGFWGGAMIRDVTI